MSVTIGIRTFLSCLKSISFRSDVDVRDLDQLLLVEVTEELLHLKDEVVWVKSRVAQGMVELRKAKMRIVESLTPGGA